MADLNDLSSSEDDGTAGSTGSSSDGGGSLHGAGPFDTVADELLTSSGVGLGAPRKSNSFTDLKAIADPWTENDAFVDEITRANGNSITRDKECEKGHEIKSSEETKGRRIKWKTKN